MIEILLLAWWPISDWLISWWFDLTNTVCKTVQRQKKLWKRLYDFSACFGHLTLASQAGLWFVTSTLMIWYLSLFFQVSLLWMFWLYDLLVIITSCPYWINECHDSDQGILTLTSYYFTPKNKGCYEIYLWYLRVTFHDCTLFFFFLFVFVYFLLLVDYIF